MTTDPGAPPAPSVERSTTPCPETLEELGATYDANYYQTGCGPFPYDRTEPHWARFFGGIATRLIEVLKPRRVLDAGCALGFLVEAFWDRGVEAWGIDISSFAKPRHHSYPRWRALERAPCAHPLGELAHPYSSWMVRGGYPVVPGAELPG